jgi:hypothetical protein
VLLDGHARVHQVTHDDISVGRAAGGLEDVGVGQVVAVA